MPNYVRNEITFEGKAENIGKVLAAIGSVENGAIDFNKIIPMPETLNMASGTLTNDAILTYLLDDFKADLLKDKLLKAVIIAYLAYTDSPKMWKAKEAGLYNLSHFVITPELVKYSDREIDYGEVRNEIIDRKKRIVKAGLDKKINFSANIILREMTYCEAGKQYIENVQKYGSTTWYDWCVKNWGTKWNACDAEMLGDNLLCFSTAWSAPEPVLKRLAVICVENGVKFEGCAADEDVGSNVCKYSLTKDGYELEYLENCSPEAYAVYEEVWGSLDEDSCFGRNEDGTPFRYDCKTCPNHCGEGVV